MNHGRIVEQAGSHQDLLAANSYYARLCNVQFSRQCRAAGALEGGL